MEEEIVCNRWKLRLIWSSLLEASSGPMSRSSHPSGSQVVVRVVHGEPEVVHKNETSSRTEYRPVTDHGLEEVSEVGHWSVLLHNGG